MSHYDPCSEGVGDNLTRRCDVDITLATAGAILALVLVVIVVVVEYKLR